MLIRPTCPDCSVKNRLPLRASRIGVCGPRAPGSLIGYSSHLPRTWVEPADHALLNARVPDVPLGILRQTVRLALGGHVELADLARPRIETSELAGKLAGPPDRPVSGGVRVVRPRAKRGSKPLLDRDGRWTRDQHRARDVLDRVVRRQVRRDGFELGRRQLHHGGDAVLPPILGVAPRVRNQVETMAARARGLHLLTARAFRQLYGWRSTLPPARGAGTTLPARGCLLPDCGGGERRGKERHQRQAEKCSLSHTSSRSSPVRRSCGYYRISSVWDHSSHLAN